MLLKKCIKLNEFFEINKEIQTESFLLPHLRQSSIFTIEEGNIPESKPELEVSEDETGKKILKKIQNMTFGEFLDGVGRITEAKFPKNANEEQKLKVLSKKGFTKNDLDGAYTSLVNSAKIFTKMEHLKTAHEHTKLNPTERTLLEEIFERIRIFIGLNPEKREAVSFENLISAHTSPQTLTSFSGVNKPPQRELQAGKT